MSDSAGRPGEPSRLREIPPAPPSYRPKWRAEGHRLLRFYEPLGHLEYAVTHAGVSLAAAKVLESYARTTDVDGTTRVSLREIARNLNRSPGQIHRHVKQLIELGFMENAGACIEDLRHRVWRIAGMDRRGIVYGAPGDNRPSGTASSRARRLRHPADSYASSARIRAQLPREQVEPTRASTQDAPARPWEGTAQGIQASREALARRRSLSGGCDAPGAAPGVSHDAQGPSGALGAENGAQDSAERLAEPAPEGAPRSVVDDACRVEYQRASVPSCSTMSDYPPDEAPDTGDEPEPAPTPDAPAPETPDVPPGVVPVEPQPAAYPPDSEDFDPNVDGDFQSE